MKSGFKNIRHKLLLYPLGILLLISGCSTRKNTPINRAYHTVTSHYNINFNGGEALKAGEAALQKSLKDNYTTLLPIYPYPAKEEISSAVPSFDRAIEKASKSIYKHSIFIRGKEYVKTMDDAYLMMGKAYFYKQDYIQAQRVFSYIIATHKTGNCKEEAMVWLTRSLVRQNYFPRAEGTMNEAQYAIYPLKSKKLNQLFHGAAAEYYLTVPNGDKQAAIDHILDLLKNKPKKDFRTRLYFILGQLYESMEQPTEAHNYFMKVIKKNPSYEMEFNARMHLASNYDGSPSSKASILKELNKMLKEEKNKDFQDQIYYAISEIYRIDENETEQINNLALSVSTSTQNNYQRTYSSLKLADIYFNNEQYVKAQAYYDTATLSLPKNYPNYTQIIKKNKILTELVTNLKIIQTEDSLQRIAALPPAARTAWVNKMVTDYIDAEQKKKKAEADKELALQNALGMANVNVNTNTNTGKWYFYNPGLISSGRTEFLKRWGTRKLEDNWRISNKQQISFEDLSAINNPSLEDNSEEESDSISKFETDPKKPGFYLQNLPLSQGAKDTSNRKIAEAIYNAALIYLDMLKDNEKGNQMLETLTERYPKHEYTLPSYYLLYLNYQKAGNPKSENYKNIILSQYPNTDYAKLIQDPQYYEKLAQKAKSLEIKYEETYQAYSAKQWNRTITLADEALPLCTDTVLASKYSYLRAIAKGQTEGENSLKEEMYRIVTLYPKTEVAGLAKLFLATNSAAPTNATSTSQNKKTDAPDTKTPQDIFVISPQEQHFIIMIVNVHKITGSILDIKNDVAAFNRTYYGLMNLNISSIYINQNEQILTIAKFKNQEVAMNYYNNLIEDEKLSPFHKTKAIVSYAISAPNYTSYYNQVDQRASYEAFFKKNYLKED